MPGLGLKGVGFDARSPDPIGRRDLPVHRVLMQAEMPIVENLTAGDPAAVEPALAKASDVH